MAPLMLKLLDNADIYPSDWAIQNMLLSLIFLHNDKILSFDALKILNQITEFYNLYFLDYTAAILTLYAFIRLFAPLCA